MLAEIKDELVFVLLCIAILAVIAVGLCMEPFDNQLTIDQLAIEALGTPTEVEKIGTD